MAATIKLDYHNSFGFIYNRFQRFFRITGHNLVSYIFNILCIVNFLAY